MATSCAAVIFSVIVPWSWALASILAPPHWAPALPLDWQMEGGPCREDEDLSAQCFSPLSSESGSSLENRYTNNTASLEGSAQHCGFVWWGSCVPLGGRFWRLSN